MDEQIFITKSVPKSAEAIYQAFRNAIGDHYGKKEYTTSFYFRKMKSIFFKVDDKYMENICAWISRTHFYIPREDKITHSVLFYDAGAGYEIYIMCPAVSGSHLFKLKADKTPHYV